MGMGDTTEYHVHSSESGFHVRHNKLEHGRGYVSNSLIQLLINHY